MISVLNLWRDEEGQDLIEYSLLMAFVAIAVVGLFAGAGGNVKNVWTASNTELAQAATKAGS
jgi:Flp pilus assembly pilin Flp